jgi:hypothetical protein
VKGKGLKRAGGLRRAKGQEQKRAKMKEQKTAKQKGEQTAKRTGEQKAIRREWMWAGGKVQRTEGDDQEQREEEEGAQS